MNTELMKWQYEKEIKFLSNWQPIETVPLREDVICLWATCTVGHTVFYNEHDVKCTYAKYWMPFPKLPTDNA